MKHARLLLLIAIAFIYSFSFPEPNHKDSSRKKNQDTLVLALPLQPSFTKKYTRLREEQYDAFIEGAKDGFKTAVRIIPYLVAILVGIGVFRASGAMDLLIGGMRWCVELTGVNVNANGWKFRANGPTDPNWTINLGGNMNDLTQDGSNLSAVGTTIKLYPTRKTSDKIYCTVE